ncbi:hemerythrin domain-containing protein [Streptomyces liliifuscus]|uniref:Hemerythrin domain-containing protein n=1 Tax=Streptomyces liliifuscus TaxID=2797636 RepID=A0A7T7L087_9ACTN|nr:hemerythrin domain-containing protein [Streptomyces liliifuscus]QQM44043.1 hemerythrin domain-containing protein [Streptomyces liliifuscus]
MTTERPQPNPQPNPRRNAQPQPDDIGGILIHRGLREELSRLADAAESGRRAERVQEQIELVIAVLHQHHHGEDEKLHPLVRDREPSIGTILDELEKEHTLIQKLADDAADRTRPLPERAPVIRELLDVLRPHLALEEAEVFPAITRQISQAEFEEFVKGELKAAGPRLPALFGMLLHYALPGERKRFLADVPTLIALLWRAFWRRGYERRVARVYG